MSEDKEDILHSKKKIIQIMISFCVIIFIIIVLAKYLINDDFRNNVDTKVLGKKLEANLLKNIEINSDANPQIYAYSKYIAVLNKNVLQIYNQDANEVSHLDVNITTPYMEANNKYLAIAEENGQKLYLISDIGIKWEKDIEGEIYRVSINENGYVSVIVKNTPYRSTVIVYDFDGNELFRVYSKDNYSICSEISNNNKYLAIGQIDYSGTIIKSIVKIISIEKALNNSELDSSTLYTYESESNKILNDITFNSKNEAICLFDAYIQKITAKSDERLYDITSDDLFADINLGNDIIIVKKENTGVFSYDYKMDIKNTVGKSDKLYILEKDAPKELKSENNYICLKLVNQVQIISTNGWLQKQYITNDEIQKIVTGDGIIGIVYNNKIEIISL